jgi:hypothetical protein
MDTAVAQVEERIAKVEERKKALCRLSLTFNGIGYVSGLEGVDGVSEAEVNGLDDEPFEDRVTAEQDHHYDQLYLEEQYIHGQRNSSVPFD